jgi:hypothetical protein
MKIFPTNKYSLITTLTPDEVCKNLMEKSIRLDTFYAGEFLQLKDGISFHASFYRSHYRGYTGHTIDDSTPPEINGFIAVKEDHTTIIITTELGQDQKSIFVAIMGLLALMWLIVAGGIWIAHESLRSLIFPSTLLLLAILFPVMIMHVYITSITTRSKELFTGVLKAKITD